MNEKTNNLYVSLAKAQGEFAEIQKTKTNPFFQSKYADLADIRKAVQPTLSKYGISVVQIIRDDHLVTILSNGEDHIESSIPINTKLDSQKLGSELTYKRRYCLSAILNVIADEDDDGNQAVKKSPQRKHPQKPAAVKKVNDLNAPVKQGDLKLLSQKMQERGWTAEQVKHVCRDTWKKENSRDLTVGEYKDLYGIVSTKAYRDFYPEQEFSENFDKIESDEPQTATN